VFPAVGALQKSLYPVTGAVLRMELEFQTFRNILNKFFNNSRNFWFPPRISGKFSYKLLEIGTKSVFNFNF